MAYNSNKIEGSTLTLMQAQLLYSENKAPGNTDFNDLLEMKNHFILFDYMLDTVDDQLTHELIKEYYRILKTGTDQSRLSWFAVGDYKRKENLIGTHTLTCSPSKVPEAMDDLLNQYNAVNKTFECIVDFHARFEKIHPFQDGNGRIGRMILFKECLANNIVPALVLDRQKLSYINGLDAYFEHPKKLIRIMEKYQKQYSKTVERLTGSAKSCPEEDYI